LRNGARGERGLAAQILIGKFPTHLEGVLTIFFQGEGEKKDTNTNTKKERSSKIQARARTRAGIVPLSRPDRSGKRKRGRFSTISVQEVRETQKKG